MKNKRIDIIFGCNTDNYKTFTSIIKAIESGETVIKSGMPASKARKVNNKYNDDGDCISVGVYNNYFCRALRKMGLTDIRYGSTSGWKFGLKQYSDSYTIYS